MPERPGPWDLLDRDSDPVAADTVAIDSRLAHFRSLADAMRTEGQRLAKIGSAESLAGEYADELRSASRDVAQDLDKVVGRYDAVVQALQVFQPAVSVALTGSAAALDDAINASSAQRQAASLVPEVATDGQALTQQQQQVNDDKASATAAAAGQLHAAKAKLSGVLETLDEAGRQAAATVRRGFSDGLTDSGWDRFKYAFKKFLKILVKILTYVGMALAVIALVIPGVGELVFAAGLAIGGVVLVADVSLKAMGEGSWVDIGVGIAGLVTFGVGKLFGPAIKSGLRSTLGSIRGSARSGSGAVRSGGGNAGEAGESAVRSAPGSVNSGGSAAGSARSSMDAGEVAGSRAGSARSGASEEGPAEAAPSGAAPSVIPANARPVPHPDLGPNNPFRTGEHSWQTPEGVTHTPMSNVVGYKGVVNERAEHYLTNGPVKQPALPGKAEPANGNDNADWKGFYAAENEKHAAGYADGFDSVTGRPTGGVVLRYEHGHPTTIVTPAEELGPDANVARGIFGVGDGPFVDGLGASNQVLRNPVGEDGFELVVPWSLAEKGTISKQGTVIADRSTGWDPQYRPDE
jgi:hypothetical protein